MSNSVRQRTILFNGWCCLVFYTQETFVTPKEVLTKLKKLQNRFVSMARTKTTSTRHKVNPTLVFAPKNYEGLDLHDFKLLSDTM
ncbi:hypothetical protein PHMEG_00012439 [Phytophthora megakarya]|uniref:Uncharacterized protein n=1 Tax=Phytophthora megakarya TaxID=4795 RepID=A0A225WBA6_9STRA|nr:hypothetical protein PHMEG_00012439 [Phytophthora megakarya]